MSDLAVSLRAARESFTDGLLAVGFKQQATDSFVGDIDVASNLVEHVITIPDDFPIAMPKVHTTDGTGGMSWHRERTGHFCLWSSDEAGHLPWSTAEQVIARVQEWHAKDAVGWPDDPPDLDLESYWPPGGVLVLHGDLDGYDGTPLRLDRLTDVAWQARPGPATRRHSLSGMVVNAGELTQPVHTIDELIDVIDDDIGELLQRRIDKDGLFCILVRYTRQGYPGVLGLARPGDTGDEFKACTVAHSGETTLRLRAGLDAAELATKSVAIIGIGAVGSHVADLLGRSGIGRLTLIDNGYLRPGNSIRHLAGPQLVGLPKVEAVRNHLHATGVMDPSTITTQVEHLTSATQIEGLAADHDLLIDATGNGPATALVLLASEVLSRPAVTVCLQHDGRVARVDRAPLRTGEQHDAALPPNPAPHEGLREGGCGEPVSPTAPWAVLAAASMATGAAVDSLTQRNQYPASLVQVVIADPSLDLGIGTT